MPTNGSRTAEDRSSFVAGAGAGGGDDPGHLIMASIDPAGNGLVCAFDSGRLVRLELSRLPKGESVVFAMHDGWGGISLVHEDGSTSECAGDYVLYLSDPAYRAKYEEDAAVDMPARVGERVRRLRETRGFTQKALAERLGMAPPNLARIESGQHMPELRTLLRIAKVLGVALEHLVGKEKGQVPRLRR